MGAEAGIPLLYPVDQGKSRVHLFEPRLPRVLLAVSARLPPQLPFRWEKLPGVLVVTAPPSTSETCLPSAVKAPYLPENAPSTALDEAISYLPSPHTIPDAV